MTDSDNKRLLAALDANWQAEMEGHIPTRHWRKERMKTHQAIAQIGQENEACQRWNG
jgi:hypothetical protein